MGDDELPVAQLRLDVGTEGKAAPEDAGQQVNPVALDQLPGLCERDVWLQLVLFTVPNRANPPLSMAPSCALTGSGKSL